MAYCTTAWVKSLIDIKSPGDDNLIESLIEAAQQAIDGYCHRSFEASSDTTRYIDAVGDHVRGRVLFLLNPDAYLHPGALQSLVNFLDMNPQAAAVGPNVLNPDGSWQAAVFRFPSLWDLACEAVFLSVLLPHSRLFSRKEIGGFQRNHVREVDWIQGCALAIRREVWDAVPVVWGRGRSELEAPPAVHPCARAAP